MNIQNKEFCTYTTRDAAHKPPPIGVAHLGPPGIHSFWIAHLNGPRRRRWKLPRPPTILALVGNQSKILDDSPVPLVLVLALLALPPVAALFVVFADVLYAPLHCASHHICHICPASHKTSKCGPFPDN